LSQLTVNLDPVLLTNGLTLHDRFKKEKQMQDFQTFIKAYLKKPLPIPHYIAKCIADSLNKPSNDPEGLIAGAGKVRMDLNPDGSYRSGMKRLIVQAKDGLFYEITVQEITR
jgi:hypothetical protein